MTSNRLNKLSQKFYIKALCSSLAWYLFIIFFSTLPIIILILKDLLNNDNFIFKTSITPHIINGSIMVSSMGVFSAAWIDYIFRTDKIANKYLDVFISLTSILLTILIVLVLVSCTTSKNTYFYHQISISIICITSLTAISIKSSLFFQKYSLSIKSKIIPSSSPVSRDDIQLRN